MYICVVLQYKDKIYSCKLENKKITFGGHKKDTVYIFDMKAAQITVRRKGEDVQVSCKSPYPELELPHGSVLLDQIYLLSEHPRTTILFSHGAGMLDKRYRLTYDCIVTVGRDEDNAISMDVPYISRKHCVIRSEKGIVSVEDSDSTHGTYVNGNRIKKCQINSGDTVELMNLKIHLKDMKLCFEEFGENLKISEKEKSAKDTFDSEKKKTGCPHFRRSPRLREHLPDRNILLASPPAKGQKFIKGRGGLSGLISSGAMAASTLAMGAVSGPLMLARGAMLAMPISNLAANASGNRKQKKRLKDYELLRQKKYFDYISEQKAVIDAAAAEQRKIVTQENPAPLDCVEIVSGLKRNLWERMASDSDFLKVRVGMGYEPLCVEVQTRTGNGTVEMEDDEVKEMSEALIEETRIVDHIPLRISLLENTSVGFIGERSRVISLVKGMLVSLVTLHCFQEVRIVGIFDEEERDVWSAMRWLPHSWDKDKQFRFLAFDPQGAHALCEMFGDILRRRESKRGASYGKPQIPLPYYIFVLGSRQYLEKEDIMNHLFFDDAGMGITSLFLFDDLSALPQGCRYIVDLTSNPCAYPKAEVNNKLYFSMDPEVTDSAFDSFARTMSAIELDGFALRKEIPGSVTFLQGYKVETAEQLDIKRHWDEADVIRSLKAPIGVMGGNHTFYLDVHERRDGPNGVIAGTVGSGKSELIQSWILSMAVQYSPYDVNFVVIDYKGGGTANFIEALPHVVGTVTNLGNHISRSLISLKAEIERRERIIHDQAGVRNIDDYRKRYGNAKGKDCIPHLIIVIDEFAELKKEMPEFMPVIQKIARVGRAYGIHLILASQKPGGVVDDQTASNIRFRICLRVQNAGDSREMLNKPDAAYITQAGRAYIQVGSDEVYEQFQSFWSGAPYLGACRQDDKVGNQVRIVEMNGERIKMVVTEKTRFQSETDELAAVVHHICEVAEKEEIVPPQGPWLPELPEYLSLQKDLMKTGFGEYWGSQEGWLKVPVGRYDIPEKQQQGIQYMDFVEQGHFGVYGAPSTGKTSFLKLLVMSLACHFSPKDVNIYIMDFGGWSMGNFSCLPHVGGVALDMEEEKIQKLAQLIDREMEERKKRFLRHSVGTLEAYRSLVSDELPAVFLLIDQFPAVFELYPDMEQFFVKISSVGAAYGIHMVFTANSTNGVRTKVTQNVAGAAAFQLTEKGDYIGIVGRLDGKTLPKITGRAFFKGNPPIEFQTAMYADGGNDVERVNHVKKMAGKMNETWKGCLPKPIPIMPEHVTQHDLMPFYTVRNKIPVGMCYDTVEPAVLDLSKRYGMVISGEMGADKSRVMIRIARMIKEKYPEDRFYIIDSQRKALRELEELAAVYAIDNEEDKVGAINGEIVKMLTQRKRAQEQAVEESGLSGEDIFLESYEQICIVIDDLREFVDVSTDDDRDSMERIARMAEGLGVLFFAGGWDADLIKYNEIESLTMALVGFQNGVVVGGTPQSYPFFKNKLGYQEKTVEAGEGNGFVYDNGTCRRIRLAE